MNSVRIKVVYFAQARELAGTKEEEFVLMSPAYVEELFSRAMSTHPELAKIRDVIRPLVNGRLVAEKVELRDGDRVALIPPVGGG